MQTAVLEAELDRNDFEAWTRNVPRRECSLRIPFEKNREAKFLYSFAVRFESFLYDFACLSKSASPSP